VLVAAEALGEILENPRTAARDRINAARVVLGMVSDPLGIESADAKRAEPTAGWPEVVLATAHRAVAFANHGLALLFDQTPGVAWKESGLEQRFLEASRGCAFLPTDPTSCVPSATASWLPSGINWMPRPSANDRLTARGVLRYVREIQFSDALSVDKPPQYQS
jgi:hypothetical protein